MYRCGLKLGSLSEIKDYAWLAFFLQIHRHARVQQKCRIGHDQIWDTVTCDLMRRKKIKFIIEHMKKKTTMEVCTMKFKRFWSNPIFCTYLWGFPAHGNPHITAPCTSLLMDSFPGGNNPLSAPHSSLSPNSLSCTPPGMSPLGADPPLAQATKGNASYFLLVVAMLEVGKSTQSWA